MKQVFVCLFSADFSGVFSVVIFQLHLKMTFMYSFFFLLSAVQDLLHTIMYLKLKLLMGLTLSMLE